MRNSKALFVVVREYGHDEATGMVALSHRMNEKALYR